MKNPIEDVADLDTYYDNESEGDCPDTQAEKEPSDTPRIVRAYEFEIWNRPGPSAGRISTVRIIANTKKEALKLARKLQPSWNIRGGRRIPDLYADAKSHTRGELNRK